MLVPTFELLGILALLLFRRYRKKHVQTKKQQETEPEYDLMSSICISPSNKMTYNPLAKPADIESNVLMEHVPVDEGIVPTYEYPLFDTSIPDIQLLHELQTTLTTMSMQSATQEDFDMLEMHQRVTDEMVGAITTGVVIKHQNVLDHICKISAKLKLANQIAKLRRVYRPSMYGINTP